MAGPALQAAGVVLGARSLLPRAVMAAALALLILLLVIVAPLALLSSSGAPGTASVPSGIPPAFVPIYRESAAAFGLDWLVLASVHQEETGFSTHPTTYRGLNFAGCCAGPFQFNVTNGSPSTWDSHRWAFRRGRRPAHYPHPQAPHPSVYDDFDAGMAAGSLLRANGADGTLGARTFGAVRAYNGAGPVADAYARRVLDRARGWQADTGPISGGGGNPPRGPRWRRARLAGEGTGGLAVRHALGTAACRHRHRRRRRYPDPGRFDRPRHDAGTGAGLRAVDVPRARAAVLDVLRASVAPGTDTDRRHRAARRARRIRRLHGPLLRPASALRGAHLGSSGGPAALPRPKWMMARRGLILVPALVALVAGCQDPYSQDPERRRDDTGRPAAPARDERARGDELPPPARESDTAATMSSDAQRTPRAAVNAFCSQWGNWSWRTIGRQQRRLARLATGTLARQLAAEARLRAQDRALRRDRLGTRGQVVAIDVKSGRTARDAVCVTSEEQLAHGRADSEGARHRVYLATILRTDDSWAVRRWEPQP